MRLAEAVVGLGQAVLREVPDAKSFWPKAKRTRTGIRGFVRMLKRGWSSGRPSRYLGMIQTPRRAASTVDFAT